MVTDRNGWKRVAADGSGWKRIETDGISWKQMETARGAVAGVAAPIPQFHRLTPRGSTFNSASRSWFGSQIHLGPHGMRDG